jgi:hypothetical protein
VGPTIDTVGYLLAALVFSIGFLSQRRHASLDSLGKNVYDRSANIRKSIESGNPPGPSDLEEDLALGLDSRDPVAVFSRAANWLIVLSCLGLGALGIVGTIREAGSAEDKDTQIISMVILVASAIVLTAVSEYDRRRLDVQFKTLTKGSILGTIYNFRQAMAKDQISQARDELESIAPRYPGWVLLAELLAEVEVRAGNWPDAQAVLDRIDEIPAPSHFVPLLRAALEIERQDPAHGLVIVDTQSARDGASRYDTFLRDGLSLMAGRPQAMFSGTAAGTLQLPTKLYELDPDVSKISEIARMVAMVSDWQSNVETTRWLAEAHDLPVAAVVRMAVSADPEADPDWDASLHDLLSRDEFASALNSAGMVCLARRRFTDALTLFEAAIRARSSSSTSHWGRAVACHDLAWTEAAADSLRRARSLQLAPVLANFTEQFLSGKPMTHPEQYTLQTTGQEATGLELLQFALIGAEPPVQRATDSLRSRIVSGLLTARDTSTTATS